MVLLTLLSDNLLRYSLHWSYISVFLYTVFVVVVVVVVVVVFWVFFGGWGGGWGWGVFAVVHIGIMIYICIF